MFVYLDNSATTRQDDRVTELMIRMMKEDFGNPSSLHRMGATAEKALRLARKQTADSLGVREDEIYFTSGGTEGDNTAIFGGCEARRRNGNKIITSKVEHPAVLEACKRLERQGLKVIYLDVDRTGLIDLEQLERELDKSTILITVMHVNNELGTVQPLSEIGRLKRQAEKKWGTEILFHTDGVQSYGKEAIELSSWGVDMLSVSGHKIHGPKGIGALYVKSGLHIPPMMYGGGQEKGFRSGTENLPAIAGFGCAAQLACADREDRVKRLSGLRERLLNGLRAEIKDITINSPLESPDKAPVFRNSPSEASKNTAAGAGSPAILNVSFLGCRGEVLLHMLEQKEIYVSTGSACSSHKKGSHVLTAAGLSAEQIEGAIRFSLTAENTREQIDYAVRAVAESVESQRRLRSAFGKKKR